MTEGYSPFSDFSWTSDGPVSENRKFNYDGLLDLKKKLKITIIKNTKSFPAGAVWTPAGKDVLFIYQVLLSQFIHRSSLFILFLTCKKIVGTWPACQVALNWTWLTESSDFETLIWIIFTFFAVQSIRTNSSMCVSHRQGVSSVYVGAQLTSISILKRDPRDWGPAPCAHIRSKMIKSTPAIVYNPHD